MEHRRNGLRLSTRTDARRLCQVQCPPRVTRDALLRTVYGAVCAAWCQAIVAFARICYNTQYRHSKAKKCDWLCVRWRVRNRQACMALWVYFNAVDVPIHFSAEIVNPVLHETHFSAPATEQSAPACGVPFEHVHVLATESRVARY